MTTKTEAVLTALKNCEQWLGGAAIVETEVLARYGARRHSCGTKNVG